MITFQLFTLIIILSILVPIAGAVAILLMLVFEQKIGLLESENTKIKLEKELQYSEYMQLNQQIQPHFLFNTMNILLSLARLKRNDQLIEALENLSLYFKYKYQPKEPLISFDRELAYTNHYLVIQKIRFGQRLKVSIEIDDICQKVMIPPYMLQTLVENSFKHGLEKKIGDALVTIRCRKDNDNVCLQVVDNGIGIMVDNKDKSGHGMENISKRLELLFQEEAQLTLEAKKNVGAVVTITWPFILENETR